MTIKELRGLTGLTQVKFAEKYNISARTLQGWEAGRFKPPGYLLDMLERLVKEDLKTAGKNPK